MRLAMSMKAAVLILSIMSCRPRAMLSFLNADWESGQESVWFRYGTDVSRFTWKNPIEYAQTYTTNQTWEVPFSGLKWAPLATCGAEWGTPQEVNWNPATHDIIVGHLPNNLPNSSYFDYSYQRPGTNEQRLVEGILPVWTQKETDVRRCRFKWYVRNTNTEKRGATVNLGMSRKTGALEQNPKNNKATFEPPVEGYTCKVECSRSWTSWSNTFLNEQEIPGENVCFGRTYFWFVTGPDFSSLRSSVAYGPPCSTTATTTQGVCPTEPTEEDSPADTTATDDSHDDTTADDSHTDATATDDIHEEDTTTADEDVEDPRTTSPDCDNDAASGGLRAPPGVGAMIAAYVWVCRT